MDNIALFLMRQARNEPQYAPVKRIRRVLHILMAASCLLLAACSSGIPGPEFAGGCVPATSPDLVPNKRLIQGRITHCDHGGTSTGTVVLGPFPSSTRSVELLLSGYPDGDTVRLEAVSLTDGQAYRVDVLQPGNRWIAMAVAVPTELRGKGFSFRITDASQAPMGWAGLATMQGAAVQRIDIVKFLLLLLAACIPHVWLCLTATALPRRVAPMQRTMLAMLAMGVAATIVFFAMVASVAAGTWLAIACLAAPAIALALRWRDRAIADVGRIHRLLLPPVLLSAVIFWIGLYPFTWEGTDWIEPATRWRNLPVDNWLPYLFADMVGQGKILRPMIGSWLSSDRPPLQSGLLLLFKPLWPGTMGVLYQGMATWAQTLVLVPLLAFVADLKLARDRGVVLAVIGLSALVIVNGLFVWPKLIAAAYCAIFHYALFSGRASLGRRHWIAAGLAAGLAMLAHSGALFILAGSACAYVLFARVAAIPALLRALAVSFATYMPWVFYQRFIDPPGDRLLKYHFADDQAVTDETAAAVIIDAYSRLPFSAWWDGRLANLKAVFNGALRFFQDAFLLATSHLDGGVDVPLLKGRFISQGFFSTAYNMWFFSPLLLLLLVPYLQARGRLGESLRELRGTIVATAVCLVFWILVMFKPGSTVVHQGAYLGVIFLQLLVIRLCYAVQPWLFRTLAVANLALFFSIYAFDRPSGAILDPSSYVAGTLALGAAFIAACMLTGPLTLSDRSVAYGGRS